MVGDWEVDFFPPSGENDSPYDYILGLSSKKEQGQVFHRLETMSKLEIADCPSLKVHKIVDKIFQLPAGAHRLLFCRYEKTIVVLHACRKVRGKTKPADIQRAQIHYAEYMSQKEGERDERGTHT
ncbi:MAG: type II toxin-antitoxin system RelE/ParE family toxin [Anaerolineae bacterium]|nr:type II toxin-antitoxin system RelE/ParE family toxin [Anaerolineae bacterium]